jgi:hypothetical protein
LWLVDFTFFTRCFFLSRLETDTYWA